MSMQKGKLRFLIAAVLVSVIAVTAIVTYSITVHLMNTGEVYLKDDSYEELMQYYELKHVRSIIEEEYALEPTEGQSTELIHGAAQGMVSALKDGYSAFYTDEDYKAYFDEEQEGSRIAQGMLLESETTSGYLRIERVFAETAAYDAGMVAGETLISVDGKDMRNINIDIALGYIRGVEGTSVIIETKSSSGINKYTLTRNDAAAQLVFTDMIDDSTGYIRIEEFSGKCAEDFEQALKSMEKEKVSAVIVDIRGVSGGAIAQAVDCADLLLDEGLIAYSVSRGQETMRWEADEEISSELAVAILADGETAGVAEVFAAALQEYGRCTVIGQNTKGEAAATTIFKIASSGNRVRLVTALYYTPNGVQLQGTGIQADALLELGDGSVQNDSEVLLQAAQYMASINEGNA